MNILLIGPLPSEAGGENPGGVAHHLWYLAQALTSRGHNIEILALGRKPGHDRLNKGIQIYGERNRLTSSLLSSTKIIRSFPMWLKMTSFRDILHLCNSIVRINRLGKRLQSYDIIHIHGIHSCCLLALRHLAINTPSIVTIHSYHDVIFQDSVEFKRRRLGFINFNLKYAKATIHVSETDYLRSIKLNVSLPTINFIVHNGVKSSPEKIKYLKRKNSFCFVGGLNERKRIELVLRALEYRQSSRFSLVIAGSGNQKPFVVDCLKKIKNFEYVGSVSNENVRKIMRNSYVLVVPSRSESFGLVYIEALLEGAAVIGYAEVIEEFHRLMDLNDDEKALLVPFSSKCDDPLKLSLLMSKTADWRNSEPGSLAMQSLKRKTSDHFAWEGISNKLTTIYEEVSGV